MHCPLPPPLSVPSLSLVQIPCCCCAIAAAPASNPFPLSGSSAALHTGTRVIRPKDGPRNKGQWDRDEDGAGIGKGSVRGQDEDGLKDGHEYSMGGVNLEGAGTWALH